MNNGEYAKLSDIVAETVFDGYEYCATASQVDEADIYIIDPDGVNSFINKYRGFKKPIIINITLDRDERFRRMRMRDGEEKAEKRLRHDDVVFNEFTADKYPNIEFYTIENSDSSLTAKKIWRIYIGR